MKNIRRILSLLLTIVMILGIGLGSSTLAVSANDATLEAGDELIFTVNLTCPYYVKDITSMVGYNTFGLDLYTYDPSEAMSYIHSNYEPPMESTQNGNGIQYKVNCLNPMDFTQGQKYLEVKFKAFQHTNATIDFTVEELIAYDGTALVSGGNALNPNVTWETTTQIIRANKPSMAQSSVTLLEYTYSYTGYEVKPIPFVTYNNQGLTEGVDYTVSYRNNIDPGVGAVIVTGMGNFVGTKTIYFTIEEAQPQKKNIYDCNITLDKTVFAYDGTAKKPLVTVYDGSNLLINSLDYTVSYSNNTAVGTATATITGIGNYTGVKSVNFIIQGKQQQLPDFVWGTDNWNFINAAPEYFPQTTFREQIDSKYLDALKEVLPNTEYYAIFGPGGWLDDDWAGSCYGMCSLVLLAKEGYVPYSAYQTGAAKLHDFSAPKNNRAINSLITYYQMLQIQEVNQQQYRTIPYRSHETNIKEILSIIDERNFCIVCFQKSDWGAHAIVAYDYEYGSWTFNGVTYDGCIKICDPNSSTNYDEEANIYFNSKTYNWAIPLYSYASMTSAAGATFMYMGANTAEINQGGYLSGTVSAPVENYVARINAAAIADNRTVSKVYNKNGAYMTQASAPGDIVEDYSYVIGDKSKGTIGYNIYDAKSAYKVSQNKPVELALSMDYEDCYLTGYSKAGSSVVFDNKGQVEVNGEAADFGLSMAFDDNHPTSWFSINVEGTGANNASLKLDSNGYVLTSDNLSDITVTTGNKNTTATASFSTDYDSVLIYEINETTIGIKADADNNGTFETTIDTNSADDTMLGDVNKDGKLNIKDATSIQKYLASLITFDSSALAVADFNKDGKVNIKDATTIQKKLAGLI